MGGPYKLGKTVIHEDHDGYDYDDYNDNDKEKERTNGYLPPPSRKTIPRTPKSQFFSESKTQLRLDGLEPYVLVSAITATASFDVVTGGNLFDNSPILSSTGSLADDCLRALLLITSTSSSCLGLYSLGIFSFCIMYSKAALAREDDASHTVYTTFFEFTAQYRYKGYQAFLWSLILFVVDLFLFAIAYLPESIRPFAALGSAPIIYTCWSDWQAIIKEASIIYAPLQVDADVTEKELITDSDTNGDVN
ncbi:MAG: hypothetical protein SGBAC_003672 [Bacillariaceae sp.]